MFRNILYAEVCYNKMLNIRNRSAIKRRIYIHTVREGKIATRGYMDLYPRETVTLSKKPKRIFLSTEEDHMRGIVPIYGCDATIVDSLHTITLSNRSVKPHMKVKLVTTHGRIMSMKICKDAGIRLTVHSSDVISAVSEGKVIYTSVRDTPPLLGSPSAPNVEEFIMKVTNNVIMNNLYGLTFTVCSGCPSSTLREIQFGNRITSSGSICLGTVLPLVGCTGIGRVSYNVRVDSLTGLDGLRLTSINVSPIIPTSGGAYRLDFTLRLTAGDLTLRMGNTGFSFTSILYSNRQVSLPSITVPGPYTVTIKGTIFAAPSNNQLTFSTPNIATSVNIGYSISVLRSILTNTIRNVILGILPTLVDIIALVGTEVLGITNRIVNTVSAEAEKAIRDVEAFLSRELSTKARTYNMSITVPLP